MTEHIEQVTEKTSNGEAATSSRVTETESLESPTSTAARIVWLLTSFLLILLAFRFVFILLGANSTNGFVNFIYTLTYPLAAPFFGIFSYSTNYGVSRMEFASLVAMIVYALVAWGIVKLITIRKA